MAKITFSITTEGKDVKTAQALAEASGKKLVEIKNISEGYQNTSLQYRSGSVMKNSLEAISFLKRMDIFEPGMECYSSSIVISADPSSREL